MRAHLHGWPHDLRPVDVSVSMNLSELQKLRVLETRDQTQHACLFRIAQMILKADHAIRISHEIFLAQLHGRERFSAGARINQADWLHWAVTQGVNAAAREFFDR